MHLCWKTRRSACPRSVNKMAEQKCYEVLKWASLFLEQHGAEPRAAEILLQHQMGWDRHQMFMHLQDPMPDDRQAAFEAHVKEHAETGVPVQHLTGQETFYGRDFLVNTDVLIPRPETEEVVLEAIRLIKNRQHASGQRLTVADIGTGSGVIAITLALELENVSVAATDLSTKALATAEKNAMRLGANVAFHEGSFLEPLFAKDIEPDVIVSNPPYIPEAERDKLSRTVADFDPDLALFAKDEGLAAYKEIISQAANVFKDTGLLVFEIGHDQGTTVPALIKARFPGAEVRTIQDINGKDRIVTAHF